MDVNKNLQRATREFNLSLYGFEDEDGAFGIWDGEQFLYTVGFARGACLSVLSSPAGGEQHGSYWTLARQSQVSVEIWLSLGEEDARTVRLRTSTSSHFVVN